MTPFEPERVVEALNAAGAAYVVVGGLAVGAHGVVRATRDLDLVPDPDPANMSRVAMALSAVGGSHPVTSAALTGEALARPVSFKVPTRHGDVQVLNRMPSVPPYADLAARRVLLRLHESAVAPVCSLRDLLQMKRASGRPRDLVDVTELSELHGRDATSS